MRNLGLLASNLDIKARQSAKRVTRMYMMITSVLMALVLAINTIAILTSSNDGTQNEKRQATSVPAADIPKEIQLDIVLANTSLMTAMQPLADGRFMGTPEACKF